MQLVLGLLSGFSIGCLVATIVAIYYFNLQQKKVEEKISARHSTVSDIGKLISIIENAHSAFKLGSIQAPSLQQIIHTKLEEISDIFHSNIDMLDSYFVKYVERFIRDQRLGLGIDQGQIQQFQGQYSNQPRPSYAAPTAPIVAQPSQKTQQQRFQQSPQRPPQQHMQQQQQMQQQVQQQHMQMQQQIQQQPLHMQQIQQQQMPVQTPQYIPQQQASESPDTAAFSDLLQSLEAKQPQEQDQAQYYPDATLQHVHQEQYPNYQQSSQEQQTVQQMYQSKQQEMNTEESNTQITGDVVLEEITGSHPVELPTSEEIHQRLDEIVTFEKKGKKPIEIEQTVELDMEDFKRQVEDNQRDQQLFQVEDNRSHIVSEETITQQVAPSIYDREVEDKTVADFDITPFRNKAEAPSDNEYSDNEYYAHTDDTAQDKGLTLDGTEMIEEEPLKGSPVFDASFDVSATKEFDMKEILEKARRQGISHDDVSKAQEIETVNSIPEFGTEPQVVEQTPLKTPAPIIEKKKVEKIVERTKPDKVVKSVKNEEELISGNEVVDKIDKFFGLKK